MKKSIFFPILALVLCIGFSSCKPNEKEYTLFFKVENQSPTPQDSALLTLREEYLGIINAYMQAFNAERDFRFLLTATDEDELKAKVSELNNQVMERLGSTELRGFYTVCFFMQQNEKEITKILSTQLGTPLDQGSEHRDIAIYNLVRNDGSGCTTIPMSSGVSGINSLSLVDVFKKGDTFNNLAINADLNSGAGGPYIYIHGACGNTSMEPITDVIVLDVSYASAMDSDFTYTYQGRTYHRVNPYNSRLNGDLNQGTGGTELYLMYTKDSFGYSHNLVNMCIYIGKYDFKIPESDMGDGVVPVPMIDARTGEIDWYWGEQADFNCGIRNQDRWIRMLCKYN